MAKMQINFTPANPDKVHVRCVVRDEGMYPYGARVFVLAKNGRDITRLMDIIACTEASRSIAVASWVDRFIELERGV